ncbi:MAG TPA: peptidylprolyl isomerase [Burkholderiales bacterium]|jgi:peptidyl-prolyl cis-trans isomerase C|nr:peptidylprolyl isomerase [Burkholderiales bacterium]
MIRTPAIRHVAMALALCIAPVAAAQSGAKVNGTTIPAYRIEAAVKSRIAQGQADTPELRKGIRDALINQEIVAQEAIKKGLEKQPQVAARIELDRQMTLVNAYFDDYLKKNPVTDDMLKKEYERLKPQLPAKEYRVRHILVDKEEDAKNIIAQIKKGGNFEKLAAEFSNDPGSKARGGDLDWGPAERYVKPFSDTVTKLKKGQMTDVPVHTDFGYHIIRVDDERATKVPSFDEAKGQLQQLVQNQIVQKAIGDLRAKAKVE